VIIHVVDPAIDTVEIVAQALIAPTNEDSFVTHPYLQLAAALPLLVDNVGRPCAENWPFVPRKADPECGIIPACFST
jgi:hypothetical protein